MPNTKQIEELEKRFEKKWDTFRCYSWCDKEKDKFWQFIRKALKENTEEVINAMLVEEKEIRIDTFDRNMCEEDIGFNQCCALQKKKGQKLKDKLK